MSEKKLDCEIVRDLLPLYHDDVVSEVTKTAVAGHLEGCEGCSAEYGKLCAELPEEEVTPRRKFMRFMRNQKRMRILTSVLSVILVCGLLVGGYFLQLQFPVFSIPEDEITIEQIYRYETDNEYRYFLMISFPAYDYMKIDTEAEWGEKTGEGGTLYVRVQKPLISRKDEDFRYTKVLLLECGYDMTNKGLVKRYYDDVNCGGKTIWNLEKNADDEVPLYVYKYDMHYYNHSETCSSCLGNIGFYTEDGTFRYWDNNGNVIDVPPAAE